jgi:hypothetical protein
MISSQSHNQGRESQYYPQNHYPQINYNQNYDYSQKNMNHFPLERAPFNSNLEYPIVVEKPFHHKIHHFSNSQVFFYLTKDKSYLT